MSYIQTSSVISVQKDLSNPSAVDFPADLVLPEYKELIPRGALRRMSGTIRTGVWCGLACNPDEHNPIVVGTGLGCLQDSVKFLEGIGPSGSGELPDVASPTPFIQSTHNAIAGQLALLTSNHGYNLTHVQDGHSFETALIDALLLLEEGHHHVLVGGVDERIELLSSIARSWDIPEAIVQQISEGAGFFRLSQSDGAVALDSCSIGYDLSALSSAIKVESPDLVLFGNSGAVLASPPDFQVPLVTYSDLCGTYMTNPVFGMELGRRVLCGTTTFGAELTSNPSKVCILNNYNNRSYGLITMSKS